jgi:single-strand DNA-binding protein
MASRSLNQVFLIGNLTRDPELRYTPQGTAVCQFGLATNRDWVTANGEKKEDVQYHRLVAWSKLAELCGQLLKKGTKIFVEGRIVYRSFEGKDGQQKNITEVVMNNMIILSPKGTSYKEDGYVEEVATEEPEAQVKKSKSVSKKKDEESQVEVDNEEVSEEVSEDEIPF